MSFLNRSIKNPNDPSPYQKLCTPSDSQDVPAFDGAAPRGFHIDAAGDIAYIPLNSIDGTVVTLHALPAASYWPYEVSRVMATNTTATIVLVY